MGADILIILGLAAIGSLTAAGVLLWLRRHRWLRRVRLARGRAQPRYPVILLHGLLGFDELEIGPARHEYFRGVTQRLRRAGIEVHRPRVAGAASVAVRAQQLARRIEELSDKRVNIIAHSMGGLDARYAVARLGLSERVASLTTVATPHRGTPLADLGTRVLGEKLGLRKVLATAGVNIQAFYDITTARMAAFNEAVEDARGVSYASVLASASRSNGNVNLLLRPTHRYLLARGGPNDGLVPVASQVWGEVLAQIEADHWAQIGWSRDFDAAAFYEELMRELRARGF